MKQIARKISAGALLLLFASYIASATLFVHTHSIDGEQIVHSHFSFGANRSSHSHTKAEITLIATLTTFTMVVVAAIALNFIDRRLLGIIITPEHARKSTSAARYISLRAPPVVALAA